MTDTDTADLGGMDRAALVDTLHAHLEATAGLPIDPAANRWLGEAEAVVADIAEGDPAPAVVTDRAGTVVRLLESAGDTDNDEAAACVDAALAVARELVARGGVDDG